MYFSENHDKLADLISDPSNNDRFLSDILKDFEKSGGTVLGRGRYAVALTRSNWNHVVKLFFSDDSYLKFVRFVLKNPKPSFPKFLDKPRKIVPNFTRSPGERYLYVVRVEKLIPITEQEFEDIQYYIYYGHTDFSVGSYKSSYTWMEIKKNIQRIESEYKGMKSFLSDYDSLMVADIDASLDITQANILKRSSGEFVLNDPFWAGETPYQTHDRLVQAEIGYDEYEEKPRKFIKGGEINVPKVKERPEPVVKSPIDKGEDVPF
jgi:hypothetical protein